MTDPPATRWKVIRKMAAISLRMPHVHVDLPTHIYTYIHHTYTQFNAIPLNPESNYYNTQNNTDKSQKTILDQRSEVAWLL